MADRKFLDSVYDVAQRGGVEDLYDRWAASYEDEISENGYATPARLASAMRETGCREPVLDVGCGTGLSGLAMRAEGYDVIDGTDLSAEMLRQAEAKGIYRTLWQSEAAAELPVQPGAYPTIAAVGVVSPGAAPPEMLAELFGKLEHGGRLAFSFNDHALADDAYMTALEDLRASGGQLLFEAHGTHLPGIGLKSTAYIIEKS